MLRNHLFQDPFAAAKLVEFAATFPQGSLHYAHKLFSQIPHPTIFSWNTLIRGFANSPSPAPSLHLFLRLLSSDSRPNSYTFPFLLKACTRLATLVAGEQLHGFMIKSGADLDIFSINGLIHMYTTCQRIDLGHRVFYTSNEPDIVSWNAMLSGYINCGLLDHAQHLFDEMPERGIVSWNAMINGYAKSGDIRTASELFDRMPERNVESWNTLIAGHAKCGRFDVARRLFDEMPIKNVVSWSAMITGYAQGDCPGEALALFEKMKELGVRPNLAAIVSLLSACSQLGALERGRQVHAYIQRNKMKMDSIIGTALIDMYAKCGCINKAYEVFDALAPKDVFSWTAMIAGLAANGHGMKALELFAQMELDGIRPNEVTFVGVLCACSHGGLVESAERYFDSMRAKYGMEPTIEHYGCLIDALGRAGLLEEAVSLVQAAPANAVLWGTLLGACWIHGNAEIAEYAIDRLVELKPEDGGVFVLLSNIYAMRGRWDKARRMRMLMKSKGLEKIPGCSSIEVHGIVHSFYVRDRSHPKTFEIYQMLDEIVMELKLDGHKPNTTPVLFDIEEREGEHAVAQH
ncbi:pentatricopeptide repeat-containing protein At2g29760, chloroplastic-like [Phoenix dactylifera]|uniref:Pentatricopeptide repeat-containing protein At2g29760, chloroplastic-like n=1 Tax=Phoenix dactylifera TaxID=42345 RepID=A0A8B7CEI7_PHODC|nr:pentatricopeptide repeat-containing protein At2g29760, chloroplastic-like [Phoenix dactylifera]